MLFLKIDSLLFEVYIRCLKERITWSNKICCRFVRFLSSRISSCGNDSQGISRPLGWRADMYLFSRYLWALVRVYSPSLIIYFYPIILIILRVKFFRNSICVAPLLVKADTHSE